MDDFMDRASAAYFAESAVAIVLFLLLLYYSKIYKRVFLRIWACSWMASSLNFFVLGALTAQWNPAEQLRHVWSFLSTLALLVQLLLLLLGSIELTRQHEVKRRHIYYWTFALVIASLLITVPFAFRDDLANERYLLRVGFRYLIVTLGFVTAGVLIGLRSGFTRTNGRRLIATSFFIYGAYHTYYLVIVACNAVGFYMGLPAFFGLIEIVLLSITGLSMVIYLLEDERLKLLDTNRELATFLYRTSHDLRAPIATILSITSLAQKEVLDKSAANYIKLIESRAHKLDVVIGDIVRVSENKNLNPRPRDLNFKSLVMAVFEEVRLQPGADSITFRYKGPDPAILTGDYAHLKIILMVLLENSIKYRDSYKPESVVEISFVRSKSTVIISVLDNGQGISPNCQPKVFDMFYRGNTNEEGTGLGLYIAAQLVAKINGKITVTSELGSYTTFTLTLNA